MEFNTFSYAKQTTGCNRAYHYEEVQNTNSHQRGSNINLASHEGMDLTTNIVYALTRKIETKTNVAYATTGRLHQTYDNNEFYHPRTITYNVDKVIFALFYCLT